MFGEDISQNYPVKRSTCDVRALMNCEILYLNRESMKAVEKLYPEFILYFRDNVDLSFNLVDNQVRFNILAR